MAEDVGLLQTKAALRDVMNRCFANVKSAPNLGTATLLNPRFKDMHFSTQEKDSAKGVILIFSRRQNVQSDTLSQSSDTATDCNVDQPSTSTAST